VPFPEEAKNKESPNSRTVVETSLDEIPLILGFDSQSLFAQYNDLIWTSQWQFFLYSLDIKINK
jgi:hypothetical protein